MPHPVSKLALVLGIFALAPLTACENNRTSLTEEQAERGLGLPDTVRERHVKLDPRCDLNETIQDPEEGTPEYVIHQLYQAVTASGDDKANFEKFYSHFPEDKSRKWVRDQYFAHAKKHVSKYLQQDAGEGVVFKICERRKQGEDKWKIFIQSLDPKKSNPPITVQKNEEGVWKVVFFTP